MRAKQEYDKWCALEGQWEESRYSRQQELAYITGFNRAVEIMKQLIKENQNEITINIPECKTAISQRRKAYGENTQDKHITPINLFSLS